MKGFVFALVLVGVLFLALGGFVNGDLPQVVELRPTSEWHAEVSGPGDTFASVARVLGLYK